MPPEALGETAAGVVVDALGKYFAGGSGGTRALEAVSFQARPGEVLGLLGENGAGKTTALRILAGYLLPTTGSAQVAGHDVVHEPLAARAQVGYLPEQVPLPPELRVREYLRYRAELKAATRPIRSRRFDAVVDEVLAEVGLVGEQRRLISQLSKGYRQRVGLADALLHRPQVLLLDEPTDGLDPNQRSEVLQLIRRLGQTHTVILSTHVLPEVESVCQQVVILSRGRVAAQGRLSELLDRLQARGRLEVVARGDHAALYAALQRTPGVAHVLSVTATGRAASAPGATHAQNPDASGRDPSASELAHVQNIVASDRDPSAVHRFLVELAVTDGAAEALSREQLVRAVLAVGELRELTAARSRLDAVFRFLTAPSSPSASAASAAPGPSGGRRPEATP